MITQTLYLFPWDPKSSKTILRIHQQHARIRKLLRIYQVAPLTYFGRVWKLSTSFFLRKCCQKWKKMVEQFFIPDFGWKLSQLLKTLEIHVTRIKKLRLTTSSNNPWNCLRNTDALGWSSVSDAFCNRLSYIERTNLLGKTQNLRPRNISLYLRRELQRKKPEEKKMDSTKNLFKIFHD